MILVTFDLFDWRIMNTSINECAILGFMEEFVWDEMLSTKNPTEKSKVGIISESQLKQTSDKLNGIVKSSFEEEYSFVHQYQEETYSKLIIKGSVEESKWEDVLQYVVNNELSLNFEYGDRKVLWLEVLHQLDLNPSCVHLEKIAEFAWDYFEKLNGFPREILNYPEILFTPSKNHEIMVVAASKKSEVKLHPLFIEKFQFSTEERLGIIILSELGSRYKMSNDLLEQLDLEYRIHDCLEKLSQVKNIDKYMQSFNFFCEN